MLDNTILELILGAIIFTLLYYLYNRKRLVFTDDEFLEFLSYEKWKTPTRIRREIEARHRGKWFGDLHAYKTLVRLEGENLIERRSRSVVFNCEMILVHEFRKKNTVTRKKNREKFRAGKLEPQWSM